MCRSPTNPDKPYNGRGRSPGYPLILVLPCHRWTLRLPRTSNRSQFTLNGDFTLNRREYQFQGFRTIISNPNPEIERIPSSERNENIEGMTTSTCAVYYSIVLVWLGMRPRCTV